MEDKWTKFEEINTTVGTSYIDYINQECTMIKRVWNDGYEETYEIAQ